MPKPGMSRSHHCPGRGRGLGNCRSAKTPVHKRPYCSAHKTFCPKCKDEVTFMKESDMCPNCGWKHSDYKHPKPFDGPKDTILISKRG